MEKISKVIRSKRGEGYIDVCIIVLVFVMIMAFMLAAVPVFVAKIQLDNFADELVREAEIAGAIGSETTARAAVLSEKTVLHPTITWSRTGKVQLNQEFTVTLKITKDIGFGNFGSFPVTATKHSAGTTMNI